MSDIDPAKIVRVVDVETSGLPEDEFHAICEIGWVDVDLPSLKIGNPKTFLVNPGHSIPPHVRAVHHISDRDVASAMPPDQAVALLLKDLGPDDVLCAHRADFEREFIKAGDRRWICSYKCGLRAWPDMVSHGNQSLRYALGVDEDPDFDPAEATPPHRSLPDARITAHILRRLLHLRPLSRLVTISEEPGFLPKINFGKHRGTKFVDLPTDYLQWIGRQEDMDPDVLFTAKYWLEKRV